MKLRIAVIIERADITLGGAERSVFELASALSARGHDADIIAARGRLAAKNIRILAADTHGKRISLASFGELLKSCLAEQHYDIVHSILPFDFADVYQPRNGCYAEAVIRHCASYDGTAMRVFKRMTAFANFRRGSLLRAERKLSMKSEGPVIAAISGYVAEQFKSRYRIEPHRIVVIRNGVKPKQQINTLGADKLRSQILGRLHLTEADNPVLLLFAGHDFRRKGLGCLIKALRLVLTSEPGLSAYLIVAGRERSGAYRRLAGKLGIDNRIVFLGAVRHIQNLFAVTDVAVLPTFYDPCSRFILEALAAGKPVITTVYDGAADFVGQGRHGWIVREPADIPQLTAGIRYFCNRENIRLASEAIKADGLADSVSVNRLAGQLESLYNTIIDRRKSKCTS